MGEDIGEIEKKIIEPEMKETISVKKPVHFVLVHGFSHGGWCWYKIKCLLENYGHKVSCPDLKGCGLDQADADQIVSFDDYNEPLVDLLSSLADDEEVILVGHSAGGLSVTDAIYKFGKKKISVGVYIAATMLKTGFVTQQDITDGTPDFSEVGEFSDIFDITYGLGPEKPATSNIIKKHLHTKLLYHMCPLEDITLASMLLRPGPAHALQSTRFEEGDVVDKVPRVYIKTIYDRVIKLEQQEKMIKKWPPLSVYAMESDHSPFFCDPLGLAALLVETASSTGHPKIEGNM